VLNLAKYRVFDPAENEINEERIRKAHTAFLAEVLEKGRKRDRPGYMGYEWVGSPELLAERAQGMKIVRPMLSRRDRAREDRL
jgi:hypothetical protein